MSMRTLGPEMEWIVRFHIGWEENEISRVWKLLSSKPILKTLKRSLKEKTQKRPYLLEVDLDHYTMRQFDFLKMKLFD